MCGVETCYSKVPGTAGWYKELLDKHFMICESGKFRHFLKCDVPLVAFQRERWFLQIFRLGEEKRILLSINMITPKGCGRNRGTWTFHLVRGKKSQGLPALPTFHIITVGMMVLFFQIDAVN